MRRTHDGTPDERDVEIDLVLKHIEEHFPASYTARSALKRHIRVSRDQAPTPVVVEKMWTFMCSLRMPFEPSTVTVWTVSGSCCAGRRLRDLLPIALPLSHTSIQLSVKDGQWHYCGTQTSLSDLLTRSLRIVNTRSYAELLRNLHRYLMCGFSLTDNPPLDMQDTEVITVLR